MNPLDLASYGPVIPVIVSSRITKTGPVISGDTTEVALVQVDPGYAGDPGHPGTGTVVGFACGGPGGILNTGFAVAWAQFTAFLASAAAAAVTGQTLFVDGRYSAT